MFLSPQRGVTYNYLCCDIENYLSVFLVKKFLLHFEDYIQECYETVYYNLFKIVVHLIKKLTLY